MVQIQTTYSSKPVEVAVSAEKLIQFLLDVQQCAKCYPFVDKVEQVSAGVFRWTMQERKVGSIQMKAVHITKYTRSGNSITWENLQGGNMSSTGKWTVNGTGNKSTLQVEATVETDIEIPKLLVGFAKTMGQREMAQSWDAYLISLKKTAESGKITKVAPVEDVVVKDQKFEKVRLQENLRTENYNTMVSDYYDIVTETYQSGWGNHFHFAPFKTPTETLEVAVTRLEHEVADSARITKDSFVLDVGCGVGGPTLEIAKYTGCRIRGLNINKKQVGIATERAKKLGLSERAGFDHGDAMKMPYADNTFDVVTFFESTCHMPDKQAFIKECYRVLKPGGRLSGSEWLQCEKPTEKDIIQFIEPICAHHSVPHMGSLCSYRSMMEKAGFYVHIAIDLTQCGDILRNWEILDNKTINTFKALPKGSVDPTIEMMISGAIALSEGARAGAFVLGRFMASKDIPKAKL
ncbi:Sterol 24-C-methyltransferase [Heterostelium album PN500]|uniref:Sterol 24-C-methyltransferase n=1 Tax=Heterostelium pallidum (strain ATCC 26659 / Pp 5 / PN500) TaxID=670386 RepID=D3B2B8_HETP5|nr:Sterol 24-C-methyltransferase [Heterostelium album PN500]EFA84493.1 Sterol 24-C-methyltransferase [Heterostelium album PN500]|eukprot:XP_020436607.1 Sterol 24-C-methyltransferase [Heterostelium album PN500]